MTPPNKTTLWQIHDDRPGHHNQLRGLTSALTELLSLDVHTLRAPSPRSSLAALWSKRFPLDSGLPAPDLILGAGHATHLAVLAARRAYGGLAIVLMKPSLPSALFDLCLIPEHDQVSESEKVVTTRGVLNIVRPTQQHNRRSGLLLIGGPSAAHDWSNEQMLEQITTITSSNPSIQWRLTNSRRTPPSFLEHLAKKKIANLQVTLHQDTHSAWVPEQLAQAAQVWVSEDSVSMVYEALTSGAAVGVLDVPSRRHGRVAAGVDTLTESGWATRFADWQPGVWLAPPPAQLNEARRCAEIVCRRLRSRSAA
ncbi:MAG: hypothetical protein GXP24_03325 [Planctomycetes bacterium]|nr:hypothetical protein [Planctomycetota bacterium]